MRPRQKYHVIYRHSGAYPVSVMCAFLGVSRSGYYLYPASWQTRRPGRAHRTAAGTQFPYLRLPADVAMAENSEHFPQSQNCAADHEEV